jgi:dCMP deaminase
MSGEYLRQLDCQDILFVEEGNRFILAAKNYALSHSLDRAHPTGAVLVKHGRIIGQGANGSDHHDKFGCARKQLGVPTGERYDLCPGCAPVNHSERRAVIDAQSRGFDPAGADLYLWGHWWCCEACRQVLTEAGVKNIYLLKNSQALFGERVYSSPSKIK